MKSEAQESDDSVLSEEERLQLLTKAGQRNRLFILALAGVLGTLMLVSVGLNIRNLFSAGDEPRIEALEKQIKQLVSQVLCAQERDYQQVMNGLKAGMRDLANMLPGSRSWLADYNEMVDRALLNSRKRSEEIEAWSDKAQQAAPAAKLPGSANPG
jgi:hypothetical protein